MNVMIKTIDVGKRLENISGVEFLNSNKVSCINKKIISNNDGQEL